MKDCPFNKYCDDDCSVCTSADKAEKVDRVVEAMQPIIANIMEVLFPVVEQAIQTVSGWWHSVIECYPSRRVIHLALHHPKQRVRQKNIKRIMRWLQI